MSIPFGFESMPAQSALSGKLRTEHFVIRYRPGSRAGASVDRTAHLAELEYAEIVAKLELAGRVADDKPFELYLYDDLPELAAITGVRGTGGYSSGRESHVPWDNDQTRKHELVHIVVAAMDRTGKEKRNIFFAEGLANSALGFVHGVPVHAVAAYELQRKTLPKLESLTSHPDFYRFLKENPGLNAYDVGGSYFLYLLESHPPSKVMDYYHGLDIQTALGVSLEEAEAGWHARLTAFPMRPALRTLLSQRRGDGGAFTKRKRFVPQELPADVLGEADSWTSVISAGEPIDEVSTWTIGKDLVTGKNPSGGDWSHVEVPGDAHGDCVIRIRAKAGPECWGLKVRYGPGCEAILLGQGAFIYTPKGGVAHTDSIRLAPGRHIDIALRVRNGHAEMYVQGNLLLEADLKLEPSRIGFGLVGGTATIKGFAFRDLTSEKGPKK